MDKRLTELFRHLTPLSDWRAFDPTTLGGHLLPHLYVLDVEHDTTGDGVRLRVRLTGTALDQAFGRPLAGQLIESILHGPRAADVIKGFHHSALAREPLWMRQIVRIADKAPRFVEGIVVPLDPARIYGGLVIGAYAGPDSVPAFERQSLATS
jgi:hypothetical protein